MMRLAKAVIVFVLFAGACYGGVWLYRSKANVQAKTDGYRVVSYDSKTEEWVILRTGTYDGEYQVKRLVVVCDFYQGPAGSIGGPASCDLPIGEVMPPFAVELDSKSLPSVSPLRVSEMSARRLSITQRVGKTEIDQQFVVVRQDLITPPVPK